METTAIDTKKIKHLDYLITDEANAIKERIDKVIEFASEGKYQEAYNLTGTMSTLDTYLREARVEKERLDKIESDIKSLEPAF